MMTYAEADALPGLVVLEFGAAWCGFCRALRPHVSELIAAFPQVCHIQIEDGPGEPLGRSFGVKIWPTFVFLRDGKVAQISIRPAPAELRRRWEAVAK